MADFIQALDPSKLVIAGTTLSFVTSAFSAPIYNLPIFLFGVLAQESSEAIQSLRAFTIILSASMIYDIIWMAKHSQNWFIRTLTILILIIKLPTAFSFATALRQRSGSFAGLGFQGNDLSGPTVWSMPGGFTSPFSGGRDGYQNVDDVEAQAPAPKPFSVPVHVQPSSHPPPPPTTTSGPPGGYQAA